MSVYESRAITEKDWRITSDIWTFNGWECREPVNGVVYLRRHVSGPVNPDDGGWVEGKVSRNER